MDACIYACMHIEFEISTVKLFNKLYCTYHNENSLLCVLENRRRPDTTSSRYRCVGRNSVAVGPVTN